MIDPSFATPSAVITGQVSLLELPKEKRRAPLGRFQDGVTERKE
jgi:hypothetical protein